MSAHNLTIAEHGVARVSRTSNPPLPTIRASRGECRQSVPDDTILQALIEAMKTAGYAERDVLAVRLSLEEAIVNAFKHGNRRDPVKQIKISYHVTHWRVRAEVEDEGQGFDPDAVPDPRLPENLDKAHGRGVALMRAFMTEVRFNRRGNKVTLSKSRSGGEAKEHQ